MLATVWELIKGLFGGKEVMQVGSRNRAISGVTVGDNASGVVVGDNNVVHVAAKVESAPEKKTPIVQVSPALTNHPLHGIIHFLTITILNSTDRVLFLGNFVLEMNDKHIMFFKADCATGEPQRKRELCPGDKHTFFIDVNTLHEIGRPASDYVCAVVDDAVGPPYKSGPISSCIEELLRERQ